MLLALCTLGLSEGALRVITKESDNGQLLVAGFPLLPLRPDEAALRRSFERNNNSKGYWRMDSEIGWVVGTGKTQLYQSDDDGVRVASGKVYPPQPSQGVLRVVTVGDSFTHGDDVADSDTWQAHIEMTSPKVEVLNYGVAAYGTDQAFLRWRRDARGRGAQVAILGIWPENVCRNLNQCRYYLVPKGDYLCKPRFRIVDQELVLVPKPNDVDAIVAALMQPNEGDVFPFERWRRGDERDSIVYSSRLCQVILSGLSIWNRRQERQALFDGVDEEGLVLTCRIAEQFCREARDAGCRPLVVIMPMRDLLPAYPGDPQLPLSAMLKKQGVLVVDPSEAFSRATSAKGDEALYFASGHYSRAGNLEIALAITKQLRAWYPSLWPDEPTFR